MKFMKSMLAIAMVLTLTFSLAGCGSTAPSETSDAPKTESSGTSKESSTTTSQDTTEEATSQENAETTAQDTSEAAAEETSASGESQEVSESSEEVPTHSEVLVVYFSATGTTKGVAEKIASVTGGDLYEILAKDPYTEEDLNYNNSSSRSTTEQNDKNARPEIGSEDISLEGYTTIYLGFPIWWGEEPRILDTFVEKYNFDGITIIPFCTSGGSGIGRSGPNMEALAGSGTWLQGDRLSANVSEEDLQSWVESLK